MNEEEDSQEAGQGRGGEDNSQEGDSKEKSGREGDGSVGEGGGEGGEGSEDGGSGEEEDGEGGSGEAPPGEPQGAWRPLPCATFAIGSGGLCAPLLAQRRPVRPVKLTTSGGAQGVHGYLVE